MMPNLVLNRENARLLDRRAMDEYGMSGLVLMENAGRGATDLLCRLGIDGEVVLCCGKGNNAGDGFVIARHLDLRGFPVRVLLWTDPKKLAGDAAENFNILAKSDVPIEVVTDTMNPEKVAPFLERADWIVDALLGTGTRGEPRPPFDTAIRLMNAAERPLFAVDLPSGLDCDTGNPAQTTIRAVHTCTFATIKTGFLEAQAKSYVGELHVADIGVPRRLLEEMNQK